MPRPLEVSVENLLLPAFFLENLSATHSAHLKENLDYISFIQRGSTLGSSPFAFYQYPIIDRKSSTFLIPSKLL